MPAKKGQDPAIEMLAPDDIKPYEQNPRFNDLAVDPVIKSIQEFGFKNPILIDKSGVIICGHTRYKAALRMGLEKIPCIRYEDLTEAQIIAYRITDNKTGENSEWDWAILKLEMIKLSPELQEITGLAGEDEAFTIQEDPEKDDAVPDIPKEPKAKMGDLYLLGDHRLLCGDATNPEDLEKLMEGNLADLLITDPPYNVDYTGPAVGGTIQNDNMEAIAFIKFLTTSFKNAKKQMKEGAPFYIWHADLKSLEFREAARAADMPIRQILVWVKNTFAMGRHDYHWRHEPCLYGWKEGAAHYFIDDLTQDTVFDEILPDFNKLTKEELKNRLKEFYADKISTTVFHEDKPSKSIERPTMKPVKLFSRQMRNSSKRGDLILDIFGGSGTSIITAEQCGRKCNMIELDPIYVDVIIARWEKYTGRQAEKRG